MTEKQKTLQHMQLLTGTNQTVVSFLLENDSIIYSINSNESLYALFLQAGDQMHFRANVTANMTAASIKSLVIEGVPNTE